MVVVSYNGAVPLEDLDEGVSAGKTPNYEVISQAAARDLRRGKYDHAHAIVAISKGLWRESDDQFRSAEVSCRMHRITLHLLT